MQIVVDTNIIISAILKDGFSRKSLLNNPHKLITPSYTLSEITKHKEDICKRVDISFKEFDILVEIIFKYIKIINKDFYANYINYSCSLIDDIKDVPFLALALMFNCPIWSDDKHFKKQDKIRVLTTKEMMEISKI